MQGQLNDCQLNDEGIRQAAIVAKRIGNSHGDANVLISSPLTRALQTAEAIGQELGLPTQIENDLSEMSMGIYEGGSYVDDFSEYFAGKYKEWSAGEFGIPVDGGESIEMVLSRASNIINKIISDCQGTKVIVVTHGRWLRVFLSSLVDGYDLRRMDEMLHANTAMSLVHFLDSGAIEVEFLKSSSHLAHSAPA